MDGEVHGTGTIMNCIRCRGLLVAVATDEIKCLNCGDRIFKADNRRELSKEETMAWWRANAEGTFRGGPEHKRLCIEGKRFAKLRRLKELGQLGFESTGAF